MTNQQFIVVSGLISCAVLGLGIGLSWLYFRPGEAAKWPNSTSPVVGFAGVMAMFLSLPGIAGLIITLWDLVS
jgi:hypothetical protein